MSPVFLVHFMELEFWPIPVPGGHFNGDYFPSWFNFFHHSSILPENWRFSPSPMWVTLVTQLLHSLLEDARKMVSLGALEGLLIH